MIPHCASLSSALRETARRIASGADYQWTHNGHCNCGHLAQTITGRSARELHEMALEKKGDDWGEHALATCPRSGYAIDDILSDLYQLGLEPRDVANLERLSDRRVLRHLDRRELNFKDRRDVVLYMDAWAEVLETH